MRRVKVQCTLIVEVDFPDGIEDKEGFGGPHFVIEDNGCPGSGIVGMEIEKVMREEESKSCCWACALHGKNKILSITEVKEK